jgi:hypothetical protein
MQVMGLTAVGSFNVCGSGCVSEPLAVPAAPKDCPADCNGANGACNTGTGECVCQPGWSGPACDAEVEAPAP